MLQCILPSDDLVLPAVNKTNITWGCYKGIIHVVQTMWYIIIACRNQPRFPVIYRFWCVESFFRALAYNYANITYYMPKCLFHHCSSLELRQLNFGNINTEQARSYLFQISKLLIMTWKLEQHPTWTIKRMASCRTICSMILFLGRKWCIFTYIYKKNIFNHS